MRWILLLAVLLAGCRTSTSFTVKDPSPYRHPSVEVTVTLTER